MYDTPLGSNPPNTFRFSAIIKSLLKFGLWVQRFLYLSWQTVSCHIKRENVHLSIYMITPTESYGRFEPGGVLDVAILAQSSARPPKCMKC